MTATLIIRDRSEGPRGRVVEIVVWRLSEPVPPCSHCFKYRLVLVISGQRRVGFDNERGKGDHRHIRGQELPYEFLSIEQLFKDFYREVDQCLDEL